MALMFLQLLPFRAARIRAERMSLHRYSSRQTECAVCREVAAVLKAGLRILSEDKARAKLRPASSGRSRAKGLAADSKFRGDNGQ